MLVITTAENIAGITVCRGGGGHGSGFFFLILLSPTFFFVHYFDRRGPDSMLDCLYEALKFISLLITVSFDAPLPTELNKLYTCQTGCHDVDEELLVGGKGKKSESILGS
jgi:hypothetical protein